MGHASDESWMREALREADEALDHLDVPIGCVIVGSDGKELARAHNRREIDADPTAHAEVLALRAAARRIGHWRVENATVFATLEPCPMCAGALVNARIARLVYAAPDAKAGAIRSLFNIGSDVRLNHRFDVTEGVLSTESILRLQGFFSRLRAAGER
jgi:tRNA(adenine34) deaminase